MEKKLAFCFVANVLPAVAPMFSRSFDIFRDIKVIVMPRFNMIQPEAPKPCTNSQLTDLEPNTSRS